MKIWLADIDCYNPACPDLAPAAMTACTDIAQFSADPGVTMSLSTGSLLVNAPGGGLLYGAYTALVPISASAVYSAEVTLRGTPETVAYSSPVTITFKCKNAGGGITASQSQTVTLGTDTVTIKIENLNSGVGATGGQIIIREAGADTPVGWYASQFKVYAGDRTIRVCSGTGFTTAPADTPPNAAYVPRIVQPALVRREIPIPGSGSSSTRLSYGELTLANADGALDYLTAYDFSGRPITIRVGEQGGAFPAGYPVQLVAVVDGVTVSLKEMAIKLKSPRANWEQPVATATYAGTGTGTVEGDASLAETVKPVALGWCGPMAPVLVNAAKLIYQYNVPSAVYSPVASNSDTQAVSVSEGGNLLTAATAFYANSAEMLAEVTNPVWSGHYKICPTEGMFLLKSGHTGKISCKLTPSLHADDCLDAVIRNVAGVINNGAGRAQYSSARLGNRLTLISGSHCGAVIAQGKTTAQLMDDLTGPIGCWWGFRVNGAVAVGAYAQDIGAAPSASIGYSDIVSFSREQGGTGVAHCREDEPQFFRTFGGRCAPDSRN